MDIHICIMGWNQRNRILKGFRWDRGLRFGKLDIGLALGLNIPKRPCARSVPSLVPMPCRMLSAWTFQTQNPKPLRIIWLVIGGFTYVSNSVACLR